MGGLESGPAGVRPSGAGHPEVPQNRIFEITVRVRLTPAGASKLSTPFEQSRITARLSRSECVAVVPQLLPSCRCLSRHLGHAPSPRPSNRAPGIPVRGARSRSGLRPQREAHYVPDCPESSRPRSGRRPTHSSARMTAARAARLIAAVSDHGTWPRSCGTPIRSAVPLRNRRPPARRPRVRLVQRVRTAFFVDGAFKMHA